MNIEHTTLAAQIHAGNVVAGWWTDINTGASILETRNRPEMMMLIVSELSEASEGYSSDSMDDKLSHLPAFDVEMADAAIRLYDLIGCEAAGINFDKAVRNAQQEWTVSFSCNTELMKIVNCVSDAMEGYRKGNRTKYLDALWKALGAVYAVAYDYGEYPLIDVIEQKRQFNKTRADHQIQNRKAEGGKAF